MKLINIYDNPRSKIETGDDIKKVNALITGSGDDSGYEGLIKICFSNFYHYSSAGYKNKERRFRARLSNDIVIAYVHELSMYAGKALPYLMHYGTSGVVIRFDGLFDPYLLAHEVGHVLGAGHQISESMKIEIKEIFISDNYEFQEGQRCFLHMDSKQLKVDFAL